ncbi:hypothetical protein GDO78_020582 [Eleutherodactylus coqui]|uniref:Uncharacterized protein n=1 Tax=Eleutherodactylus coqui TaxID=57060 RepID=A0A8J6BI68_ELECQ|nr:hypothetical protein GDO78_020582 [Eleutherodactylus coqui]
MAGFPAMCEATVGSAAPLPCVRVAPEQFGCSWCRIARTNKSYTRSVIQTEEASGCFTSDIGPASVYRTTGTRIHTRQRGSALRLSAPGSIQHGFSLKSAAEILS